MTVDASGRVYNAYNEPIALLRADGMLFGTDDTPLGWVGHDEAILPGDEHSWLVLHRSGLLARSDGDETLPFGQWLGCNHQSTVQTCMIISHLLGREVLARRASRSGMGMTPGLSIGIGAGFIGP